jgi:outer membrane protein OmpA-like peptidoglycan-associated protein
MTFTRKLTLLALLAPTLFAGAAYAAEPGFYIGIGGGQTTIDKDASDFGYEGDTDFNIDDDDTGWKAYVGYNFLPWLGIEGGYVDFGSVTGGGFSEEYGFEGADTDLSAVQGFLVGRLPIGPVDLFAKVGGANRRAEMDTDNFGKSDDNKALFAYGVGAEYILGHWGLRVEAEGYDTNEVDDFYFISAGVNYRFGGAKPAAVVAAPVVAAACSDMDNDGVCDTDDICLETPSGRRVDAVGCSCDYTLILEFAFDSDVLSINDKVQLDALIPVLTNPKDTSIAGVIDGYTDIVGDADYNLGLSQRRAESVDNYLHSKGVATGRFIPHGYGEANPVASNETEDGRAQNRRIELRRTDCGVK